MASRAELIVKRWGTRKMRRFATAILNCLIRGGRSCPVCCSEVDRFLPLPQYYFTQFKKYGFDHSLDRFETLNWREYTCPHCEASDRDRLMALYIRKVIDEMAPGAILRLVEFAPNPPLSRILKSHPRIRYRSADLEKDDVDDRVDLTDLSVYPDDSFDAFLCSHVLEHVQDDRRAMTELCRILDRSGWGLFLVPISLDLTSTREDPAITTEAGRWKHFAQGDHVRFYARTSFIQRLTGAGFRVHQVGVRHFGSLAFHKHALARSSRLYIVKK